MNGIIKKINYLSILLLVFVFCTSCSAIMENDGEQIARPMIQKIDKYKASFGHYPKSLRNLIPKFMGQYDFQAYRYQYFTAQGKDLEKLIKQGLIVSGQSEGYKLAVRFQKYSSECIYINGARQQCHYIGH